MKGLWYWTGLLASDHTECNLSCLSRRGVSRGNRSLTEYLVKPEGTIQCYRRTAAARIKTKQQEKQTTRSTEIALLPLPNTWHVGCDEASHQTLEPSPCASRTELAGRAGPVHWRPPHLARVSLPRPFLPSGWVCLTEAILTLLTSTVHRGNSI